MAFRIDTFTFNLPFGLGGVSVQRTEAQMRCAWALYVELATRVASQRLEPDLGGCRETLDSLNSLFDITRATLKEAGPGAAAGPDSVGPIAIMILNRGLRPFLVKWHAALSEFENAQRRESYASLGRDVEPVIDEAAWPNRADFYTALQALRKDLAQYVAILGRLAGVEK